MSHESVVGWLLIGLVALLFRLPPWVVYMPMPSPLTGAFSANFIIMPGSAVFLLTVDKDHPPGL